MLSARNALRTAWIATSGCRRQVSYRGLASEPPSGSEEGQVSIEELISRVAREIASGPSRGKRKRSLEQSDLWKAHHDTISSKPREAFPSDLKIAFERDEDTDLEISTQDESWHEFEIVPGSFVEIRRSYISSLGILLAIAASPGKMMATTLSSTGECWSHRAEDIFFSFPGFLSNQELGACGTMLSTTDPAEMQARVSAMARLRTFERQTERVFAGLGRSFLKVYPLAASSDPSSWGHITLKQATALIDGRDDPPVTTLLAMHQHLMLRPDCFVAAPTKHRNRQVFLVRPRTEIRRSELVRGWVTSWSPEMAEFVEKAKRIIHEYRSARKLAGPRPPRQIHLSTPQFNGTDKEIIKFLKLQMIIKRSSQPEHELQYAVQILKKMELYDPITEDTIHEFLSDLGIFAPWDDLPFREGHATAQLDSNMDQEMHKHIRSPNVGTTRVSSSSPVRDPNLGEADYYPGDIVGHLRRDFGELPAYVIDDATAHELDDGISVEPCRDREGHDWVHVHVADPTVYIHPDHIISKNASQLFVSRYLCQGAVPLLPNFLPKLTHFASASSGGQRVLTFSSLIGPEGNIVDAQVNAGIVRNVKLLTYNGVDTKLKLHTEPPSHPLGQRFEGPAEKEPEDADVPQLLKLKDVLSRVTQLRRKQGYFTPLRSAPSIAVQDSRLPIVHHENNVPTYFEGYPSQEYQVIPRHFFETGAHSLVSECMKLAGRVASICFKKAGIPALRRASGLPLSPTPENIQRVRELRDEFGGVYFHQTINHGVILPPTKQCLEPATHFYLGVPSSEGYCRVTSPLRRYADLMLHWQVKHMLLGGTPETAPFTKEFLLEHLAPLTDQERAVEAALRRHQHYWALRYIRDELANNPSLSEMTFPLTMESNRLWAEYWGCHTVKVTAPTLGLSGVLALDPGREAVPGMEVRGRILSVRLGMVSWIMFSTDKKATT